MPWVLGYFLWLGSLRFWTHVFGFQILCFLRLREVCYLASNSVQEGILKYLLLQWIYLLIMYLLLGLSYVPSVCSLLKALTITVTPFSKVLNIRTDYKPQFKLKCTSISPSSSFFACPTLLNTRCLKNKILSFLHVHTHFLPHNVPLHCSGWPGKQGIFQKLDPGGQLVGLLKLSTGGFPTTLNNKMAHRSSSVSQVTTDGFHFRPIQMLVSRCRRTIREFLKLPWFWQNGHCCAFKVFLFSFYK